ncbi:hypothetical protein C8J57DRAFT_430520 [Mycena rebaudengoi]|nr:hypothetical protein C8J57DRAFT_430520 [Mycena rebaudengoi]
MIPQIFLVLLFILGGTHGLPVDEDTAGLQPRVPRRLNAGETRCYTTQSAPSSDCQTFLSDATTLKPDWTSITTVGSISIYRPFCSGSCCLYTDKRYLTTDDLVHAGTKIMTCVQESNNEVNGVSLPPLDKRIMLGFYFILPR